MMFTKILQNIIFKKEELKENKDWILLLDVFNRNPQLLLDFVFDNKNGGMGITDDILEESYKNNHLRYLKHWSWILDQKKLKIKQEIQVKKIDLVYFKETRDQNEVINKKTRDQNKVINKKIQELEIELNELQKIKLTKN